MLIVRFCQKFSHNKKHISNVLNFKDNTTQLDVENIAGIFILFVVGLIIACIVGFLENSYKKSIMKRI